MWTAAVLVAAAAANASPAPPQLPQQWQAVETEVLLEAQGSERSGDQVCCDLDASQCKVQVANQIAQFYFDGVNNRTRTGLVETDGAIVSDYNTGKEMQVSPNNTCKTYCPLQGGIGTFGIDADAKFAGTVNIEGVDADEWTWKEYIIKKLHLGLVQQTSFYVSSGANPVPVKECDTIEPLGQVLGTENQTWTDFKAGAPPAALFAVANADTCPMDPNCQQNDRSAHRRRGRDMRNWAYYRYPQAFVAAGLAP